MTLWFSVGGAVTAIGIVWWLQRWHQRQSQFMPENWTHRMARKAWKK